MRLIKRLSFCIPFLMGLQSMGQKDFFVCYGKIMPSAVKDYGLVILESGHYAKEEVAQFKANNKKVVAYISCTEVHPNAPYFKSLKPFLLGQNGNWGSAYMDISKKEVQDAMLLHCKSVLDKGFDGLFLDTLDNAGPWGALKGMEEDLVGLINAISQLSPHTILIQNGGLWAIDMLAPFTDGVLVESVFTAYNFSEKAYGLRASTEARDYVQKLKEIQANCQKPIYILEYADRTAMRITISTNMPRRFKYFVANINLNQKPVFY